MPLVNRIIMFSPLPPMPNGIADYTFELLHALGTACETTVVVNDGCPAARAPGSVRVLSLADYELEEKSFLEFLHIYQIGNNRDHVYMLPAMARHPGLVVLHDPSLHHLLDLVTVATGNLAGYSHALQSEYGTAGRLLGVQFERHGIRERRMFFDLPMLGSILGPSLGVIVHSRFGALKVLARASEAEVTVVPHHYSPPAREQIRSRSEVREGLAIKPNEVLFVSLGFVTRAKLIAEALHALALIRDVLPPFRYLIAGELQLDEVDVPSLVRSLGLESHVITPGYVAEGDFFSLIEASDVVINLRYPVGGETSGSMIRALGGGACIVVVDKGPFAELPDSAACKLAWGQDFVDRLAALLLKLAEQPDERKRVGTAARQLIGSANSLQATLDGYLSAIRRASQRQPRPWFSEAVWSELPPHELSVLIASMTAQSGEGILPLWFTAHAVPLCDHPVRVICWGANGQDAELLHALGHQTEKRDIENLWGTTLFVDEARTVDLCIVFITAETLSNGKSFLGCLNKLLSFQGLLVISIRGVGKVVQHALERRKEGSELLTQFGFEVRKALVVAPPSFSTSAGSATAMEGRCWRAIKVSEFIVRENGTGDSLAQQIAS